MGLQVADLFIVERGGVQYKMTADQIADFVGAVRDYTAADITARDALTGLSVGDRVFVTDASSEPDVDSGWAVYRVQSTGPIVYEKIQEQESMDLVVTGVSNLSLGTRNATSMAIDNDNGTGVVLPIANGTQAGLATPAMFNDSHAAATTAGSSATNPISLSGQEFSFDITSLTALP